MTIQTAGYISWARVENFQSWEDITIHLSPGVNVFVGESDEGKSALAYRALLWPILNQPLGDHYFRSWWTATNDELTKFEGRTSVQIKLSDYPEVISRYKEDNNVNAYSIGNRVFDNPGKTVPPAVSRLFNIHDVNIHHQGDPSFFISLSDPERARYLNKLVNLDIIAFAQTNIATRLTAETRNLNVSENTIKQKKKDLKECAWIDTAEKDINRLEQIQGRIDKNQANRLIIISALDEINRIQERIDLTSSITSAKDKVDALILLSQKIVVNHQIRSQLQTSISSIRSNQKSLDKVNTLLKAKPKLEKLIALSEKCDENIKKETELTDLIEAIENDQIKLKEITSNLIQNKIEFRKDLGSVCPLCDQEIKKK